MSRSRGPVTTSPDGTPTAGLHPGARRPPPRRGNGSDRPLPYPPAASAPRPAGQRGPDMISRTGRLDPGAVAIEALGGEGVERHRGALIALLTDAVDSG